MKKALKKARDYLFKEARELEQSRWSYHFEGGSKEEVLRSLKTFQNEDGGFGHGLEPDFFAEESTPIATWTACLVLDALELEQNHPMILQVLEYFRNCKYQEKGLFFYTIPSVNQFPHAPWWTYTEERKLAGYNPTASIIGFVLKYAKEETALYQDFSRRLEEALDYLKAQEVTEKHELRNFVELYHYLEGTKAAQEMFFSLEQYVKKVINIDIDKWFSTYTTKPLDLLISVSSPGYQYAKDLAKEEVKRTLQIQLPDGSWDIPWSWQEGSSAEEKSKKHWKGIVTLETCLKIDKFLEVL